MLLTAFVLIERSVEHPLIPLHIVWDRARGGSQASLFVTGAGIFAVFLFLTYFMQVNLGFSPLKTGLAFVPLSIVLVITSTTVQTGWFNAPASNRSCSSAWRSGRSRWFCSHS